MNRFAIVFLILFNFHSFDSQSQDSWESKFAFRLFDKEGKKVTIDSFCRHWKYVHEKSVIIDSFCRGTANIFYNDSASIFIITIGAVHPSPAKFSFVNGREKMTLIFSADKKNVLIDSLVFHEGIFWIDDYQKSNKKVVLDFYPRIALFYDRGKIDWDKAKSKAKEY